jgi:ABC-type Fe3+ transport system substrate-binding protein
MTIGGLFIIAVVLALSYRPSLPAAEWQSEWERTVEAAKKEGTVVFATAADAELRRQLEPALKRRFGIALEYAPGRAAEQSAKIIQESKAGVRSYDVFAFGGCGGMSLIQQNVLEPLEPMLILPEVKDPKHWWGGSIWADNMNGNKYFFSFTANSGSANRWYNADLYNASEFRSYDDLLNPKLKGKIGFLDPQYPGAGQGSWSFLWSTKGEEFLLKLAKQDPVVMANARQLAEALAKGKIALCIGCSRHNVTPFIKAGLPVKLLPIAKEGDEATGGYAVGVLKNAPHPNAAKVFVNWILSKEGQELWGQAMVDGTRRLDVDTKWLAKHDVVAAKDDMTVAEYHKFRNHLEDYCVKVRGPATELAKKILAR